MLSHKKMAGKIYHWEKIGKFIYGQTKNSECIRTSTIVHFFYDKYTDIGVVETLNSRYLLHTRDSTKARQRN
jgi:hypothetical protein